MMRQGLSLRLFPTLKLYLDTPYPNMTQTLPNVLYRGNEDVQMYIPYLEKRVKTFGWDDETYNRYVQTQPTLSAIAHEFGHIIHYLCFGNNNSDVWKDVWKLMGIADKPDFNRAEGGGIGGGQIRAYEVFANYFEGIALGKISNIPLMQYIWELIDLHTLVFKVGSKEYTHNGVKKTMDVALPVIDGRSFVPLRTIVEELKDIKLRDVFYDYKTKEVVVIGGNNDEMWGE